MEISAPTSFKHEIHVGFDPTSGDFTGLPMEWKQLLDNSGISKDEQIKNPQVQFLNLINQLFPKKKNSFQKKKKKKLGCARCLRFLY